MEPGIHAVQPQGGRYAGTAAGKGDRHWHGFRTTLYGGTESSPTMTPTCFSPSFAGLRRSHPIPMVRKSGRISPCGSLLTICVPLLSVTDGQLPSNARAGYVIRRILRRAVRYGYTFLGMHESFIYRLLPTLIEVMGEAYPELQAQQTLIEKVIKEEEESFLRTLETGIKMLEKSIPESKGEYFSGEVAFQLYDTYGFPVDLTELILREHDMRVDLAGFDAEMQKQKQRARNAAATETGDWTRLHEGDPTFVGYDEIESSTRILRYRVVKQKNKQYYQLVLSRSPFYAEMGGQVGDSGRLTAADGSEWIPILDTKRENNLAVHLTDRLPANPEAEFIARIDEEKRTATECNHTATHLMHEALREVLGSHVEQKGSYVSSDLLRFDFSHYQKMTPEEIRAVERKVTAAIRGDYPIEEHRSVPIEEAKAQGAMALFGEKYGEEVRTVRFGSSIELCGGTHISSTGRIGTFRIVSEGAIAAGVRRIEAVTAKGCEEYLMPRRMRFWKSKTCSTTCLMSYREYSAYV